MAERVYCSVLNDSEPLIGTAPVVDVWLLLEYRPPWKTKALPQSDLAAATQDWIKVCIEGFAERGLRVRPQLIRQPESDGEGVRLLVAHGGRLVEMGGSGYDFLQELDLFGLAQGTLPRGARVLEAPRYFV